MELETRSGRIFFGLALLGFSVLMVRGIMVVSGTIPGLTLFSNPPGMNLRTAWPFVPMHYKVTVIAAFVPFSYGIRMVFRGLFGGGAWR